MHYYIAKTIEAVFDDAIARVKTALKEEGFGVLTEIDVAATFKEKLGVDYRPYRILGACNPKLALGALEIEDKIGVMLPCNVVVHRVPEGVEIAAIDPVASMGGIGAPGLREKAEEVRNRLTRVIEAV